MKAKVDIFNLIDKINSEFNAQFYGYNLTCEIVYNTTIKPSNNATRITGYSSGTLRQMNFRHANSKHIKCLDSSYISIGFYAKNSDSFYSLLNIYPDNGEKKSYFSDIKNNVCNGAYLYGTKFKYIKSRILKRIYEVMKKYSNCDIVCSGINSNITPSIINLFEVLQNEKIFETESIDKLTPPFSVIKKIQKFKKVEYKSDFKYEIDPRDIASVIENRYRDIEKTLAKKKEFIRN